MKRGIILLLLSGFALVVILLFLVVICINYKSYIYIENLHEYSVTEFIPSTNSSHNFLIKSPRKFSRNELHRYSRFSSGGTFISISQNQDDRFKCVGTCICENSEEGENNRRVISVTRNSLFFIVSSISAIFAVKLAADFFSNECSSKFGHFCASVDSHVEECFVQRRIDEDIRKLKEDEAKERHFNCFGKCKSEKDNYYNDEDYCAKGDYGEYVIAKTLEEAEAKYLPWLVKYCVSFGPPMGPNSEIPEDEFPECVANPPVECEDVTEYRDTGTDIKWLTPALEDVTED